MHLGISSLKLVCKKSIKHCQQKFKTVEATSAADGKLVCGVLIVSVLWSLAKVQVYMFKNQWWAIHMRFPTLSLGLKHFFLQFFCFA